MAERLQHLDITRTELLEMIKPYLHCSKKPLKKSVEEFLIRKVNGVVYMNGQEEYYPLSPGSGEFKRIYEEVLTIIVEEQALQ